ncbi:MAG: AraC family transcriptional regulator [Oscillospiraceae bacterium]|jgi:AraC-like DNA-binding protein|nr:AraC family transcriptional regulator [Oscillospiraceae bacterium]
MGVLFECHTADLLFHHTRGALESAGYAMHDMHELYYFARGQGRYFVEGNAYTLSAGCVLLIRAGESHYPRFSPDFPYERLVIHISPPLLAAFDSGGQLAAPFLNRPLGQKNLYTPQTLNGGAAQECLKTLCAALDPDFESDADKRLFILCHLPPLLYGLRRCFLGGETQEPAEYGNLIGRVTAYINEHLTEPFGLETLTERFYISKAVLNRQFKKVTGQTVWQYTLLKRLFLARRRILEGVSPTNAALECGWKDYSAFYRQHKARFGFAPNALRGTQLKIED